MRCKSTRSRKAPPISNWRSQSRAPSLPLSGPRSSARAQSCPGRSQDAHRLACTPQRAGPQAHARVSQPLNTTPNDKNCPCIHSIICRSAPLPSPRAHSHPSQPTALGSPDQDIPPPKPHTWAAWLPVTQACSRRSASRQTVQLSAGIFLSSQTATTFASPACSAEAAQRWPL